MACMGANQAVLVVAIVFGCIRMCLDVKCMVRACSRVLSTKE